jgi:hypothetical protein
MNDTTNPMTAAFEMQRQMIEQTQELTHETIDAQTQVVEQFLANVENLETLTEQNNEVSQQAIHAYLDAIETVMPEDSTDFSEIEQLVDDGFEQLSENQAEAFTAMTDAIEDGAAAYDEFAAAYTDAVDSSFDAFLETHERVEADVESAAENVEAAVEDATENVSA